ncbi:hypothetical protein N482_21105 [Pseudoalteromonas luteoviolacea NCIMB 1942]|uniref:Transposase DDE domain-containing protein n=1 Tax=Pseudoalteromonas luteoviolacea NCIMB 1942 TaxID=1365253 RepID=A0A166XLP0_9GAMM|nr:hypothetical protein N482_21105 [Pseudoalteromonas luteoviolacea NCIMB 1942]
MQHNAITLRSKTVELVYQKLLGLMLGYNLIRREESLAAVSHKRASNEISFKYVCQFIGSQLKVMANALFRQYTQAFSCTLRVLFKEKSPRPSRPRVVKMNKSRYPVNRKAAPLKLTALRFYRPFLLY